MFFPRMYDHPLAQRSLTNTGIEYLRAISDNVMMAWSTPSRILLHLQYKFLHLFDERSRMLWNEIS
jgi:hypothetical protein